MKATAVASPRLAFVGVGWIGRHRLGALADGGARVAAVLDPDPEACEAVLDDHPGACTAADLDALLDLEPDGVVIASPNACHADQGIRALERGIPVFCQKPLARSAAEARAVVEAARRSDRLLHVDMSYRHAHAFRAVREQVVSGELGDIFAADLTFHNAYGPDKAWFRDRDRSGGGCLVDLGIHLVDLLLWLLGERVEGVEAHLRTGGRLLDPGSEEVEDWAELQLRLSSGCRARLACSWNLHAGRDCEIRARIHGTRGGAVAENVDGSFYDLRAEAHRGTRSVALASPPDAWGGRAAMDWLRRLTDDPSFDPTVEEVVEVARVLDQAYGR